MAGAFLRQNKKGRDDKNLTSSSTTKQHGADTKAGMQTRETRAQKHLQASVN